MRGDIDEFQRTTSDFILFAIVFCGFVAGLIGMISTSIPAGMGGLLLMFIGLIGFMIKGLLE